MFIARTIGEYRDLRSKIAGDTGRVGLVPTMGALHNGHLALVNCCASENRLTVVTVFVNPTQFNDPDDHKNYPRDIDRDIRLLEGTGCNILFAPEVETVYPEPDNRVFNFGPLEQVMEGRFRPGHFNGVGQVVSRLFEMTEPDRAYFGQKDIQQLAIIRKLVAMTGSKVEIRACDTVREPDGLAMSSRNMLLLPRERENAPLIFRTLLEASKKAKEMEVGRLKEWITETINSNPFLEVEYVEIAGSEDLQPVGDWESAGYGLVICIAVWAGRVRLIDNVFFHNFAAS